MDATVTVRMDKGEKEVISDYAKLFGVSVSQFMRDCALERIEDEIDVEAYKRAKAEYEANPVSYSCEEVMREFGLA